MIDPVRAERWRLTQVSLRTRVTGEALAAWAATFDPGDLRSWPNTRRVLQLLVAARRPTSTAQAADAYLAFRAGEQIAGRYSPVRAGDVDPDRVAVSLNVTGSITYQRALDAGATVEQAGQHAAARATAEVARFVLEGGRATILRSVDDDPQAAGWQRLTSGGPCAFCLTLASRGIVYRSGATDSAGFKAHARCGCVAVPSFDGRALPQAERWRQVYDDAVAAEGQATVNAVRRHLNR